MRVVVAAACGALLLTAAAAPTSSAAGSGWAQLTHAAPFNPGVMFLLTDGRVMVQDQGSTNNGSGSWWLLKPDAHGDYADGT